MLPGTKIDTTAVVFDMDGTLIDSQAVIGGIWKRWATRHALDPTPFVEASPGRRIADTLRLHGPPDLDIEAEEASLVGAAETETEGLRPLPGARAFLAALPLGRWAVVTSAPRSVAVRWLDHTGLPTPPVMVAAGDVPDG